MANHQTSNEPIDFSVARPGTNAVLVAEEKEIHVNKEFLSSFSPYFTTLLLSPNFSESASPRVNITHNYDQLLMCIQIVHGKGPLTIGTMSVVFLQNLIASADRFDLPVVRRYCECEMIANKKDIVMMFYLACHYKFDDVKEVLLTRLTAVEVRNWASHGNVSRFTTPADYDLHLSAADLTKLMKVTLNIC